jgi:hypothetical protein
MRLAIGSILAATAGIVALAAPAFAGSLHWSGDVDNIATISLSNQDVNVSADMGGVKHEHHDVHGRLPHHPVRVWLEQVSGRGHVRLAQQPTPDNGFTAIVRIHDKAPGRGHYEFTLHWQGRDHDDDH